MSPLLTRLPFGMGVKAYNPHIKARELASKLGTDEFADYFSFAVVRNPWDWQVSLFSYMRKMPRHHQHDLAASFDEFTDFIRWKCANEIRLQKDFVFSEDDQQLVDYIGRFESINADFDNVCARLKIDAELPHLNQSNDIPYQEFYTSETALLVRESFAEDAERFGYEFE